MWALDRFDVICRMGNIWFSSPYENKSYTINHSGPYCVWRMTRYGCKVCEVAICNTATCWPYTPVVTPLKSYAAQRDSTQRDSCEFVGAFFSLAPSSPC
ncbi:ATP-dependent DNA helicase pif1 [Fusarium oxysporum f. sp. albedinis]|nr:ATP-dependent DNA helicase pif1 [Fusarium oxysporum f. sp. albedinis]